jgi:hypothetical protein
MFLYKKKTTFIPDIITEKLVDKVIVENEK